MPSLHNPPKSLKMACVLIVDDTAAIRQHLAHLLRDRCQVNVIEAENGIQALKRMHEHVFTMMVTDVNMPLLDGLKLTTLVRQDHVHKEIPIMVMTTQAGQEDRTRAIALGASDYLVKPAMDDEVVRRVMALLAQAKQPEPMPKH
jgi:two-component system chemotaxis response regulator CheY